ncbi:hypothetical protein CDIK_3742 [Cucumispora dikerogammari]|nr:hypothetical protein CDIK_3742 [Cucumispora dikerogammari]
MYDDSEYRLVLKGVPVETSVSEIKNLFGRTVHVLFLQKEADKTKTCFVEFKQNEHYKKASFLNVSVELKGKMINVEQCLLRDRKGERRGEKKTVDFNRNLAFSQGYAHYPQKETISVKKNFVERKTTLEGANSNIFKFQSFNELKNLNSRKIQKNERNGSGRPRPGQERLLFKSLPRDAWKAIASTPVREACNNHYKDSVKTYQRGIAVKTQDELPITLPDIDVSSLREKVWRTLEGLTLRPSIYFAYSIVFCIFAKAFLFKKD